MYPLVHLGLHINCQKHIQARTQDPGCVVDEQDIPSENALLSCSAMWYIGQALSQRITFSIRKPGSISLWFLHRQKRCAVVVCNHYWLPCGLNSQQLNACASQNAINTFPCTLHSCALSHGKCAVSTPLRLPWFWGEVMNPHPLTIQLTKHCRVG
jgi:hypothetical protein